MGHKREVTLAERVYGVLLLAYPVEFRHEYRAEMLQVFRDGYQEAQGLELVRFWLETLLDVVVFALKQHLDLLGQDVRYALRTFHKSPGFTLVAVVALALGIGANTAIFSVLNAVLLKPLPFEQADRLVVVKGLQGERVSDLSYPNFVDLRAQNLVFSQIAVFQRASFILTGSGDPMRIEGTVISADLFSLLKVKPQLGRGFLEDEDQRGGGRTGLVTVLSYGLWQSYFGGRKSILGEQILLDGKSFRVVGIMPEDFQFPIHSEQNQLWTTVAIDAEPTRFGVITESRGYPAYQALARLKSGITAQQAQQQVDGIAHALERQYPDFNTRFGIKLIPQLEYLVGDVQGTLLILFGAVNCLLLIACANVANLLLARSTIRQREVALRLSLGASRGRIIRQLLTESVLLAAMGGVLGLLLGWRGTDLLVALSPQIPRVETIGLDGWVLGFTLLVSVLTGIIFGLVPAWTASKLDLVKFLKEGSSTASGSARLQYIRGGLVVAEVALAFVLLTAAALLIQSFLRLQQVNPGFDPRNVLSLQIDLPQDRYKKREKVTYFFTRLLAEIRLLPGVQAAAAIQTLPLSGGNSSTFLDLAGRPAANKVQRSTQFREISLDYFKTMRIPLLKGRDFTDHDTQDTPQVAVVNTAFVQQFFPNEDPLDQQITLGYGGSGPKQIVGVVAAVSHESLSERPQPEVYVPQAQFTDNSMALVVRTEIAPLSVVNAIRNIVQRLDPTLPVYNIRTLDQNLAESVSKPQLNAFLLTLFAGIALVLTAIGIYGVMAYSVTQRSHELGIRIALGARPEEILGLVIRRGMFLALLGVTIGLGLAFALNRVLTTLLFGVSPADPATFAAVTVFLVGITFLACYVPAKKATQVDPIVALRQE